MKKVHVLTTRNNPNADSFNLPLRLHRRHLKAAGVDISLRFLLNDRLLDCDLLFLNSKYFRPWGGARRQELIELIGAAREQVERVLWFDTTDSTGTTQFDVLPHVDGYYKAQVLADRRGYLKSYYGQRVYTDYYHREFGISDEGPSGPQVTAREEDLHKIHVSWSSALGDHGHGALSSLYGRAGSYLPLPPRYSASFTPADAARTVDISCRVGRNHARHTIRFQRDRLVEALQQGYGIATEKLTKGRYWRELRSAKIAPSPFGWGEITLRDFHTFINGAALLKPDMSHLATWPPLYKEGETYVSWRWDVSDIGDQIESLLSERRYAEIARAGQETYARYLFSSEGRTEFCQRLIAIVEQNAPAATAVPGVGPQSHG